LRMDKPISSGTPSFGERNRRQNDPIAENPNPDKPLIKPETPRTRPKTTRPDG